MKHDPIPAHDLWPHADDCDCTSCDPFGPLPDRLTHRDLGLLTAAGVATGLALAFLHDTHAAWAALAATMGVIL